MCVFHLVDLGQINDFQTYNPVDGILKDELMGKIVPSPPISPLVEKYPRHSRNLKFGRNIEHHFFFPNILDLS